MDGTRAHPTERVVVGEWDEEIDVEIAPLIRSLWEAGIETVMSCQDTGDGCVWIEFADLEGLEEFVTTVMQMVSESSPLAKNITWEGDNNESWWMYELFPYLYRKDDHQQRDACAGPVDTLFLNPSLRFQKCDLREVAELMALSNAQKALANR